MKSGAPRRCGPDGNLLFKISRRLARFLGQHRVDSVLMQADWREIFRIERFFWKRARRAATRSCYRPTAKLGHDARRNQAFGSHSLLSQHRAQLRGNGGPGGAAAAEFLGIQPYIATPGTNIRPSARKPLCARRLNQAHDRNAGCNQALQVAYCRPWLPRRRDLSSYRSLSRRTWQTAPAFRATSFSPQLHELL